MSLFGTGPSRRQQELDDMVAKVTATFTAKLEETLDELYGQLSVAYPGLYVDPDAPAAEVVEYRVHETTGQVRKLNAPAAVAAHRAGLKVERRTVRATEWEVEPNPNVRTQLRAVIAPPTVQQAIEAAVHGPSHAGPDVVDAELVEARS